MLLNTNWLCKHDYKCLRGVHKLVIMHQPVARSQKLCTERALHGPQLICCFNFMFFRKRVSHVSISESHSTTQRVPAK